MRYSPNLPIEEQRRLDKLHLGQSQAPNPYREGGLASVNPFAHNSIFQGVEEGEQKQLMEYAQNELMNRRAKPPEELAYLNNIMETKGRPTVQKPLPDASQLGRLIPTGVGPMSPGPNWDKTNRPEVMPQPGPVVPQPEYPLPGPPNRPPIDALYAELVKTDFPQPIDMPRPPVMLPLPGQENPYPVGPIRPEVMPRPGSQPFLGTLLPTGQQQSGLTYSDDEKIRPPSIQLSRKHGGSLTQTVLNVLRNLS